MDKHYVVTIAPYAEQAMAEISQYIAFQLMAPRTAIALLQRLKSEIESLEILPNRILLTPEEPWHQRGVHQMLVGNYYVYFLVSEEHRQVQVIDVIYAQRAQAKQLAQIPEESMEL